MREQIKSLMLLKTILTFLVLDTTVTLYHRYKKHLDRTQQYSRTFRVPANKAKFLWNLTWYGDKSER